MPQMITHYRFGLDASEYLDPAITNANPEARAAFLLGNQGPDPFFFLLLCPWRPNLDEMGTLFHDARPTALLSAMASYARGLEGRRAIVAKAFVAGFACHYLLDRAVHPLVYYWQYGIIDADVGLTEDDENQIHAEVERDIDEAVLFSRFGTTVANMRPADLTLAAPESVLDVAGELFAFAGPHIYGVKLPQEAYGEGVHAWRTLHRIIWSPSGTKRALLSNIEIALTKGSSILAGMSYKPRAEASSVFANSERKPWQDPFTGEVRDESLEDLAKRALTEASELVNALVGPDTETTDLTLLTRGINFEGECVDEDGFEFPEELEAYRLVDNP